MKELYKLLRDHPDYIVEVYYDKAHETLIVTAKYSCSNSISGLNSDKTTTRFLATEEQAIRITIPSDSIEAAKMDLAFIEVEWAIEEIESIKKAICE